MQLNESLYKEFLEQVQELENFRMAYTAEHPLAPLDRDDPDVKRLVEAMAFFSARTFRAGQKNLSAVHLQMFRQCFEFLLVPLPAMGMIKAKPTARFVDTVFLPKGTELSVSPQGGESAIFQTLMDLKILPITLTEVTMLLFTGAGFRLLLRFTAPYARTEELGTLCFNINHLNNYRASLQVFHNLKAHIRKASVIFNERMTETTRGTPCDFNFGRIESEATDTDELLHPLFKERLFFHMPQQDLYLNVTLPIPPPNWTEFTVCFDLDAQWPRRLTLNKDVFQLFAVPAVNLKQSQAQTIVCEGVKERYPILFPDPAKAFELHSVLGVYRLTPEGMVPVNPGILSGINGSYEIETLTRDQRETLHHLTLNFPEAFEQPETITVNAFWSQPKFSEHLKQWLKITPYSRNIVGLEWEPLGDLIPHMKNTFGDQMENFMYLFTLKNESILTHNDLMCLMQSFESIFRKDFKEIANLLKGVRAEKAPPRSSEEANTARLIYEMTIKEVDPGILPLCATFTEHVENILNEWISDILIEVRLRRTE